MPKPTIRAALRRHVVPALRERGFRGELPHLRRITATATHTFTLQVSKWGGEFIIELGRAPAGPYETSTGEVVEPSELTSWHVRDADRARLRAVPDVLREVWFSYSPRLRDRVVAATRRLLKRPPLPDRLDRAALEVLAHLPECERWWAGEDRLPHVRSFTEQAAQQCGTLPPSLSTTAK